MNTRMNDHDSDITGEQHAFHEAYDTTLLYLRTRQRITPQKLIDLEGELHHLTIYEGQDWGGRGVLKNAEIKGKSTLTNSSTSLRKTRAEKSNEPPIAFCWSAEQGLLTPGPQAVSSVLPFLDTPALVADCKVADQDELGAFLDPERFTVLQTSFEILNQLLYNSQALGRMAMGNLSSNDAAGAREHTILAFAEVPYLVIGPHECHITRKRVEHPSKLLQVQVAAGQYNLAACLLLGRKVFFAAHACIPSIPGQGVRWARSFDASVETVSDVGTVAGYRQPGIAIHHTAEHRHKEVVLLVDHARVPARSTCPRKRSLLYLQTPNFGCKPSRGRESHHPLPHMTSGSRDAGLSIYGKKRFSFRA